MLYEKRLPAMAGAFLCLFSLLLSLKKGRA